MASHPSLASLAFHRERAAQRAERATRAMERAREELLAAQKEIKVLDSKAKDLQRQYAKAQTKASSSASSLSAAEARDALRHAISNNDVKAARALIPQVKVNQRLSDGHTFLIHACCLKSPKMAMELLAAGADPFLESSKGLSAGSPPLFHAALNSGMQVMTALLESQASLAAQNPTLRDKILSQAYSAANSLESDGDHAAGDALRARAESLIERALLAQGVPTPAKVGAPNRGPRL